MNILRFVEISRNAVFVSDGSYKRVSDLRGLLHNVTERAGQLDLARALHNRDFNFKKISAHLSVCKTVNYANGIGFLELFL